ncbi:MAG: DUF1992 domain-containing protein [Chloroflexi bacterium]|nr:DUF1992 domain-containing protein [Chloroflexota bacterium]
MSPERRDPDGKVHTAHSRESLVEKQLREAMEAGAFQDLPHQGEPRPLEDDSAAGEWAMAHRMLRNVGMAPSWIESDKEARRLLGEFEGGSSSGRPGRRRCRACRRAPRPRRDGRSAPVPGPTARCSAGGRGRASAGPDTAAR